jgi:hypothetical protein
VGVDKPQILNNVEIKGDTAGGGALFNYGLFAASQPVVDNNVVNPTITITAADDGE